MIEMTELYLIRNCGCDDTTTGLARMSDEQFNFFKNVIEDLNKNSTYGCMPTIEVYKIDEDMLREPNDDDSAERIWNLGDHKYVLAGDSWRIYTDEFEKRRVI